MQNLVCFAKKSVNRKPFLVRIIFPTTKIFSTATKLQRCHWEHLEAYNFFPGNKILWFLTAILRRVILFCEHDQSCSHNAKFYGLLCKKIYQQEAISSVNDFFHPPKSSELLPKFKDAVENTTRCEQGCRNKITKFSNFLQLPVWTGSKSEFMHLSVLCLVLSSPPA